MVSKIPNHNSELKSFSAGFYAHVLVRSVMVFLGTFIVQTLVILQLLGWVVPFFQSYCGDPKPKP